MPSFRWPYIAQDIALATEVAAVRPTGTGDWDSIAKTLSDVFSTSKKVSLKGRGCKDRIELLLKKHKDEDNKSLKR